MGLTWLNNGFICKELNAPFVLERDFDYIKDLNRKFTIVQRQAENAGADGESIEIIKKYKKKIIESIRKIKTNAIATKVKLADIKHNSNEARSLGSNLTKEQLLYWKENMQRQRKYYCHNCCFNLQK